MLPTFTVLSIHPALAHALKALLVSCSSEDLEFLLANVFHKG